jgi:hypothetical protein
VLVQRTLQTVNINTSLVVEVQGWAETPQTMPQVLVVPGMEVLLTPVHFLVEEMVGLFLIIQVIMVYIPLVVVEVVREQYPTLQAVLPMVDQVVLES